MIRLAAFLFTLFTLYSCANIIPPTGGPKDELPPQVEISTPKNGSVNVTGNQIVLEFTEEVDATKLESEMNIVPRYNGELKIIAKKRNVTIRFLEQLEPNTTYTLNFGNGITDVTEKNVAKGLSYSFSTGPTIDSLVYSGTLIWVPERSTSSKIILGLYPADDTASVFKNKPYYYTSVTDNNTFRLHHLREGQYKVYTWLDKNDNHILDPLTESAGFREEILALNGKIENDTITLFPPKGPLPSIVNCRYLSSINMVKANKGIASYEILNQEKDLLSCFTANHREIVFYSDGILKDSLKLNLSLTDSSGQQKTEPVTLYFDESYPGEREKKSTLKNQLSTEIQYVEEKPKLIIRTDNPIINIDTQQVLIYQKNQKISWKPENAQLNAKDKTLTISNLNIILGDSIQIKFINTSLPKPYNNSKDTLEARKSITARKLLSGLGISVITNEKNYILQIINRDDEIVVSKVNTPNLKMTTFQPGTYTIRAIIDTNGNGVWDTGDVVNHVEPENVLYYKEEINLKANWDIWDIQFKF